MAIVTMLNMEGKEAGTIELNDQIFGIEPNQDAVHTVVVNYFADRRRHRIRPEAERLQILGSEESKETGSEVRSFREGRR